ncbi:MAG: DNA alkylation repair protein [Thermodesulfobacteriota bacterium]
MNQDDVKKVIRSKADTDTAKHLKKFFKTEKGSYGENDIFLGIKVPVLRKILKDYPLDLENSAELLKSEFHEERFYALLNFCSLYNKGENSVKRKIVYNYYLENTKYINNWDLVDVSAPVIAGDYFYNYEPEEFKTLTKLAKSDYLFDRRIAIVSMLFFVKNNDLKSPLQIADILLEDNEDLINKAVGWVLRETGKKDSGLLIDYLEKNYDNLKRVTLRYAIEKFEKTKRKKFLKGDFK